MTAITQSLQTKAEAPATKMVMLLRQRYSENALSSLRAKLTGPVYQALKDSRVIEIMLDPDGVVRAERLGEKEWSEIGVLDHLQATQLLNEVAGMHKRVINEKEPVLECELPLVRLVNTPQLLGKWHIGVRTGLIREFIALQDGLEQCPEDRLGEFALQMQRLMYELYCLSRLSGEDGEMKIPSGVPVCACATIWGGSSIWWRWRPSLG